MPLLQVGDIMFIAGLLIGLALGHILTWLAVRNWVKKLAGEGGE